MREPPSVKGEEVLWEGRMWYYAPPSGIFSATWRPGHLYLTDKRLFWCDSDGRLGVEIELDRVTSVRLETRDFALVKNKEVLALLYKASKGEDIAIFSGKNREEWLKAIREAKA